VRAGQRSRGVLWQCDGQWRVCGNVKTFKGRMTRQGELEIFRRVSVTHLYCSGTTIRRSLMGNPRRTLEALGNHNVAPSEREEVKFLPSSPSRGRSRQRREEKSTSRKGPGERLFFVKLKNRIGEKSTAW